MCSSDLTTPVIYIFFDNLSHRFSRKKSRAEGGTEFGEPEQG